MRKWFTFALFLVAAQVSASPSYPWQRRECSRIQQGDGKHVGSLCSNFNPELGVEVINVYYFGYLVENHHLFTYYYANLSVDGSPFWRRGLRKQTYGDGNNLPERVAYHAQFLGRSHFGSPQDFPKGRPFQIYFQAEQKVPQNNPPFSYDNLFGNNYRGVVPAPNY